MPDTGKHRPFCCNLFLGWLENDHRLDGDELDGLDETILPLDHHTAGQIVDDVIIPLSFYLLN